MLAYIFDYISGAYLGTQQLTASDLDPRSPGTVLLPGNTTMVEPPRCAAGLWPFWRNGRWEIYEEIKPPPRTEGEMLQDYYANF